MDLKTKREVLATLIRAGRKDLAEQFIVTAQGWITFTHKRHKPPLAAMLFQVRPLKEGGYAARKMMSNGKWMILKKDYKLRQAGNEIDALRAALENTGFGGFGPTYVPTDWTKS